MPTPTSKFEELAEILSRIFAQDQANKDSLENFINCYTELQSFRDRFIGSELESAYFYSMSFEAFHIAQYYGFRDQYTEAQLWLKKSLEHIDTAIATKSNPSIDNHEQWKNYVQATSAYMKADLPFLRQHIDPATLNKPWIEALALGLETHGDVNYPRDFGNLDPISLAEYQIPDVTETE